MLVWCSRFLNRRPGLTIERQRQDIKDFDPCGLQCVSQSCGWVAFGKHLCGAATDFTLRCCANSLKQPTNIQPSKSSPSSLTEQEAYEQADSANCHRREPRYHHDLAASASATCERASAKHIAIDSRSASPANQSVVHGLKINKGLQASADNSEAAIPAGRCHGSMQPSGSSPPNCEQHVTGQEDVAAAAESKHHLQAPAAKGAEEGTLEGPVQHTTEEQLTNPAAVSLADEGGAAPFGGQQWHRVSAAAESKPRADEAASGMQNKVLEGGQDARKRPRNHGLAVATCCHHRCSWNYYVHPEFFLDLGFSPQEFELVSWMAGESNGQWSGSFCNGMVTLGQKSLASAHLKPPQCQLCCSMLHQAGSVKPYVVPQQEGS